MWPDGSAGKPPLVTVRVERIRDEPSADDGTRVLVDGVWPRGLAKRDAAYDEWLRDVAPSSELRKWFGHDPEKFDVFRRRYADELRDGEAGDAFARLRELAASGPVTLLTATRDVDVSHARVLADLLEGSGDGGGS